MPIDPDRETLVDYYRGMPLIRVNELDVRPHAISIPIETPSMSRWRRFRYWLGDKLEAWSWNLRDGI